jgi:hypothetical protein
MPVLLSRASFTPLKSLPAINPGYQYDITHDTPNCLGLDLTQKGPLAGLESSF